MHRAEGTERLRGRYLPKETRVLFVGESPPSGGTFFYAANSNLYFATEEAFWAAIPALRGRDFLDEFRRMGCYLDDLCLEPVNNLDARDPLRAAARVEGQERLAEHIRIWRPRAIIVVMIAIADNVVRAVRDAGQESMPRYVLPFPGRNAHRDRYVADLATLIGRFSADDMFLAGRR